jgi:hypothetical protein
MLQKRFRGLVKKKCDVISRLLRFFFLCFHFLRLSWNSSSRGQDLLLVQYQLPDQVLQLATADAAPSPTLARAFANDQAKKAQCLHQLL